MTANRNCTRGILLLFVWLTFGVGAWAFTHAPLGTVVEDIDMPTLAGARITF